MLSAIYLITHKTFVSKELEIMIRSVTSVTAILLFALVNIITLSVDIISIN
jgi:hypothetical protein